MTFLRVVHFLQKRTFLVFARAGEGRDQVHTKRTSSSKKFFSQEKLGIHCITLIFFFFFFFSNISPTLLFLAATRPLPLVGSSLTPVKPRFFVLGFDCLASSCTASPDSFLLPLGCSLLTKTQEIVHLRLFIPFRKNHRLTIK